MVKQHLLAVKMINGVDRLGGRFLIEWAYLEVIVKRDRHSLVMGSDDGARQIDECRFPGEYFQSIDFKDKVQLDLGADRQWFGGFKKRTTGADILCHELNGFKVLIRSADRYVR